MPKEDKEVLALREELKRVSAERDDYRRRLDDLNATHKALQEEKSHVRSR